MKFRAIQLAALAFSAAIALTAPRALGCMPGCSGYHLAFTGPLSADGAALVSADRSVTVSWQDPVDGSSATFDLLMSADPVPAYPMHSFPAQLPGQILALGLPASALNSWTWDTSAVAPGTYFLYAVFHNSPFNTLVMPFAAVSIAHRATPPTPAVLIRTPRGVSAASGAVVVTVDGAPGSGAAAIDLYAGSPPDAQDGTLIASGLPAGSGQSVQWNAAGASGDYVFKAVLRDASGATLASALSPGIVETGSAVQSAGGCSSGSGSAAGAFLLVLGLGLGSRLGGRRRRSSGRK